MAGAGTIVLDEVAALSPATQSKLLRVLEERQFERLGGTETITIVARLVALTNADLARLVSDGRFREDLYFRLSVLTIAVPPLRARPADILPLANALLERAARIHGRTGVVFSEPVLPIAQQTTAGPATCASSRIRSSARWSSPMAQPSSRKIFPNRCERRVPDFGVALRSLEDIERDAIHATLEATRYKISKSAEILGISRKTLLDKRKKYGLN